MQSPEALSLTVDCIQDREHSLDLFLALEMPVAAGSCPTLPCPLFSLPHLPSYPKVFILCTEELYLHLAHLSLEKSVRFCDLLSAPGSWGFREEATAGGDLGQVLLPFGNELWEGDGSQWS